MKKAQLHWDTMCYLASTFRDGLNHIDLTDHQIVEPGGSSGFHKHLALLQRCSLHLSCMQEEPLSDYKLQKRGHCHVHHNPLIRYTCTADQSRSLALDSHSESCLISLNPSIKTNMTEIYSNSRTKMDKCKSSMFRDKISSRSISLSSTTQSQICWKISNYQSIQKNVWMVPNVSQPPREALSTSTKH